MRVLCCFDKWKSTLSGLEAGRIVAETLGTSFLCDIVELSDGGDGFIAALEGPLGLQRRVMQVCGPLETPIQAEYAYNDEVAVVEMAKASGLALVPPHQANPLDTTTFGTGELLRDAQQRGFQRILLGLGGSATNDAGLGALQALGLRVCLRDGRTPHITGKHLSQIERIEAVPVLQGVDLRIACDVTNPFVGPQGAVAVFSKQKGAVTAEMRDELERGMLHAVSLFPRDVSAVPGAGAAGGFAGGFLAFTNGVLCSGARLVADELKLEQRMHNCDLVITGEGSYDSQSSGGKVVSHVKQIAAKLGKRVVVICGRKEKEEKDVFDLISFIHDEGTCMRDASGCLRALVDSKRAQITAM